MLTHRKDIDLVKSKGNDAFKAMDFVTAAALYTYAAQMDDKDPVHVLNRSFANLKLERYPDAIADATLAMALNVKNDVVLKRKALYRRCLAFIAQGQEKEAFADITQCENAGADQKTILILKDAIVKPRPEPTKPDGGAPNHRSSGLGTPISTSYELRDSPGLGMSAFATKVLHRGDMILAEKPLAKLLSYNDEHDIRKNLKWSYPVNIALSQTEVILTMFEHI